MNAPVPPRKKSPNDVNLSRDDVMNCVGTCPLMLAHVQLIPLRYGLVDNPALDPSAEVAMPLKLGTRPLGIRLLRDGWLYVIDSQRQALSEYRLVDGLVTAQLSKGREVNGDTREQPIEKPVLVFSKKSTLYVAYAEVQWTAKKCHQVLDSPSEREHFMQAVNLSKADCESGGPNLLTPALAERWLAEVATTRVEHEAYDQYLAASTEQQQAVALEPVYVSALPEQERQPYLWETPERFRHTSMNPLINCIEAEYRDDTLYLVVNDHLGVLRDLANYQDQVVEWIDSWANGGAQAGDNERDYLLACYIESLSQISQQDMGNLTDTSDDPAVKQMLNALANMPEPEQGHTRAALLEYLNNGGLMLSAAGSQPPQALLALRQQALDDAMHMAQLSGPYPNSAGLTVAIEDTDRRYYTREHFKSCPQGFVNTHFEALLKLGKEQNSQIDDVLNGAKFGQRGINDLIDRPRMDQALHSHRFSLKRWNTLLERITADRVALISAGHFHKSAWYYDPQSEAQIAQAFIAEYACLKDICRSDEACTAMLQYLEHAPQFSRPLFYTLPYSEQTTRWAQYAFIPAMGMTVFNHSAELANRLRALEEHLLPALDQLPESTRAVADAAQQTMAPALRLGVEKVFGDFDQLLKGQPMPDLEQLFRQLPKALPARLLDAARHEGVTFVVASDDEKDALRRTLRDLFDEKAYLKQLTRERNLIKRNAGHKSPRAQQLQAEIELVRQQLAISESRLARGISPIAELPDNSIRFYGATPGKAGLTIVFPPAQQQEMTGVMRNLRKGVSAAPRANLMGDGAALLVFVVQVVNLQQVAAELTSQRKEQRLILPLVNAVAATSAAGFAAAQGIFDTALTARSKLLAKGLQNFAVEHVHVQMGKLHIGLGIFTYLWGAAAAGINLNTYRSNWEQAVRSGNEGAQNGSVLSIFSSGGLLASNAYGFGSTFYAGYTVLSAEQGAARVAAWAASGVRLSNVFFRANLVGALFTALELGGNYIYNRYNTSPHDQWLQSTPWGQDADKRKTLSLAEYQQKLVALVQAPSVQIGRIEHDGWWKNLLSRAKVGDIHLLLPGLEVSMFQAPLAGNASHHLKIGAYRITTILIDRAQTTEQWESLSEPVEAGLLRVDTDNVILCVNYPPSIERIVGKSREELMLVVSIHTTSANGQPQQRINYIRLDPRGSGVFPSSDQVPPSPPAPLVYVDLMSMELAPHA